MTGYDRDQFGPSWDDDNGSPDGHNGCDTRNDILRRDLSHLVLEAGTHDCVVLSGTLADPYTGKLIHFTRGEATSSAVQIDHVVPLGDAWQTGAQGWTAERRRDFANDPLELLAVSGSENESKGDGDDATWLPPNRAFWCRYVAIQTAVKAKYGLWMTDAEHATTTRILQNCGGMVLPVEPDRLHPETSFRVAPYHASTPTRSTPSRSGTTQGASCEPGYSPCLPIVADLDCDQIPDSEKPIRVTGDDPYRLDADGDGWGCES